MVQILRTVSMDWLQCFRYSRVVLGVFAYVSGNSIFADYLGIYFIPIPAELVIFTSWTL